MAAVRQQLAFYGATPVYRAVLDLHGWGDLHTELHRLSVRGDWAAMTGLIDDSLLHTFAVVGEPDRVGTEIYRRYGEIVDRYILYPIPSRRAGKRPSRFQPAPRGQPSHPGGLMDFSTTDEPACERANGATAERSDKAPRCNHTPRSQRVTPSTS